MHDQKLTEEFEFYQSSPQYLSFLFGTGSEPKTDNGRWVYNDHEFPQRSFTPQEAVIRSYVGKKWTGFQKWQWLMQRAGKQPRTIDHPYLLPPATFTIANLAKNGELWWVRNRSSVLCGENGFPLHDSYHTAEASHHPMSDGTIIRMISRPEDR